MALGNFMDVFVCTRVLVCVEVRGQHKTPTLFSLDLIS